MSATACGNTPPLTSWAQHNGTVNGTNNNQMSQTNQNALQTSAYDATKHHFTQKVRDTGSGNDYFLARYYSSAKGRFVSPDWSAKTTPVPYAVFTDPQSLNLYAYVRNNPITHVDLGGHCEGFVCQMQQDWFAQHQIGNLTDKQVSNAGLLRLDHEIVLNERHLKRMMNEYVRYYREDRTHLALTKGTPTCREAASNPGVGNRIITMLELGGLHHGYDLAA
jgi:RHS repeat-associated protein